MHLLASMCPLRHPSATAQDSGFTLEPYASTGRAVNHAHLKQPLQLCHILGALSLLPCVNLPLDGVKLHAPLAAALLQYLHSIAGACLPVNGPVDCPEGAMSHDFTKPVCVVKLCIPAQGLRSLRCSRVAACCKRPVATSTSCAAAVAPVLLCMVAVAVVAATCKGAGACLQLLQLPLVAGCTAAPVKTS